MHTKHTFASIAGVIALLLLSGLGLSTCHAKEETPTPIFAFASDRNGAGEIFVLERDNQVRNLTNHPGADWEPTWSPNGATLAFTSHRSGNSDIWLLDLAKSDNELQPRNLTNHAAWDYNPAWSPSGQSIAFVSERDGDPEIFIQNLQEDTALQLTFNEGMERRPAWSPDGKYIAFAAVRNGIEEIYRIRPDGTDEQLVTPHPVQGTSPAWSPDSQRLAFVGWDEENRAGIYLIGPTVDEVELLYQSHTWLGSLAWSADGQWLTFTAWETGNHDVYALPTTGGPPIHLTTDPAWDDFLVINPMVSFTPSSAGNIAQAAPALSSPTPPPVAAGVNIADLSLAYLVNDMGFTWAKSYVNWATVEPEPGQFRWVDPDNVVKAFGDQQVKILMRVHGTPAWARPEVSDLTHPPTDLGDFTDFMTALVTRYKGQVAAYEIWNEPNLHYEWGYLPPDPATYTALLQTAYKVVKKIDPDALVISGGLATTGNGSATAYGDLTFLQGMYDAGAKGYFDALGSHPYAYGRSPDDTDADGLSFSRVVEQYQVMQANGDGDTPVWITEVGWVLQSSWDLGEHSPVGVTEAQQAAYLARAYEKTAQEWPFVEAFFVFNLDFSTVPWYPAAEPMRWYSVLTPYRTPRPAYTNLRQIILAP
ncbi:MAG: PD40 domain-containing protein [Anaerolineae bacterium]|nr:PD40 domain-containing protein [Anaerolineae bacterium]